MAQHYEDLGLTAIAASASVNEAREAMHAPKSEDVVISTEDAKTSTDDPVNHPSHYTSGDIECIDAIKASMTDKEVRGFLKGQVIKYIWRYEKKSNPLEDLQKCQWYLNALIEQVKNDGTDK